MHVQPQRLVVFTLHIEGLASLGLGVGVHQGHQGIGDSAVAGGRILGYVQIATVGGDTGEVDEGGTK